MKIPFFEELFYEWIPIRSPINGINIPRLIENQMALNLDFLEIYS